MLRPVNTELDGGTKARRFDWDAVEEGEANPNRPLKTSSVSPCLRVLRVNRPEAEQEEEVISARLSERVRSR